jgi:hypothetical protein
MRIDKPIVAMIVLLLSVCAIAQVPTPRQSARQKNSHRSKKYSSHTCGVSFELPSDWLFKEQRPDTSPGTICSITLQPRNFRELLSKLDVDVYTVHVEVLRTDYVGALQERGFEAKQDGSWVIHGRQGIESPVGKIEKSEWEGMRSTYTTGCFHIRNGSYAGLCDSFAAVLTDRKGIVVTVNASAQGEQVFTSVLKTLKLSSLAARSDR